MRHDRWSFDRLWNLSGVRVRAPRHRSRRLPVAACAVVTAAALCSFGPAVATAAENFTWTGATLLASGASNWSNIANWQEAAAPSNPIGTLTFPSLTNPPCEPPLGTCYTSHNDILGLNVGGLSIDDGHNYLIGGEQITLGAGGITASSSNMAFGSAASLAMPITLNAAQTWAVDGNSEDNQLGIHKDVTGASNALTVNLSNGANFSVYHSDVEAGAIAISKSGSGFPSVTLGIEGPGSLNGNNHNLVSIGDGIAFRALSEGNKVGPLTIGANSLFEVGQGLNNAGSGTESGAGTLDVDGSLTLHSSNQFGVSINESGTTAGSSYSQLRATGPVNLGEAELFIPGGKTHGGACEALTLGDEDTLITTPELITGTFKGIEDGDKVPLECFGTGSAPWAVIHYTEHTVTATVAEPPPPTTTALQVSNANPSVGEAVTFTATVTPETLGGEAPSGSVEFLDGGNPIGACEEQPLTQGASSSTATCMVTYSAAGTHSIIAYYPGGPNDQDSESAEKTVTVHASSTGGGGSTSGGGSTTTPSPITSTPPPITHHKKRLKCKKGFKKVNKHGKAKCMKIKKKHKRR